MAQVLRPVADITNSTWSPSPVWQQINDQSDSTVATSNNTFGADRTLEVKVGSGTDPLRSDGYSCTARLAKSSNATVQAVTVAFVDSANGVLASSVFSLTLTLTDCVVTLTGLEADLATDHANLRVRVTANTVFSSPGNNVVISEAWITLPNPAFTHLDINTSGPGFVNAAPASGFYLTLNPSGPGLLRVAGVEDAGALYLNPSGPGWLVK